MLSSPRIAADEILSARSPNGVRCLGTILHISRSSITFEVYRRGSITQLSEVLSEVCVRRGGANIYFGRAIVAGLRDTGFLCIVSVSLMDGWTDQANLYSGRQLHDEVSAFVGNWCRDDDHTHAGYQLSVAKLQDFLSQLKTWLGHCEQVAGLGRMKMSSKEMEAFVRQAARATEPALIELIRRFEHAAERVRPNDTASHRALARRELHPWLLSSPFLNRIYSKPSGHVLDHNLADMMVDESLRGDTSFARLLNLLFLKCGYADSYRQRFAFFVDLLGREARRIHYTRRRRLRVLRVGGGAVTEFERFVASDRASEWIEFELLDFDISSLEESRRRIQQAVHLARRGTLIRYSCRSLRQLLKSGPHGADPRLQSYDLVYCVAALDYLEDHTCDKLIQLMWRWTAPGETMALAVLNRSCLLHAWMEHLGEWHVHSRDIVRVLGWCDPLEGCDASVMPLGGNLLLQLHRPND